MTAVGEERALPPPERTVGATRPHKLRWVGLLVKAGGDRPAS